VAVGLVLALALACAPTTLSPTMTRLVRGDPARLGTILGIKSGPRLSVPLVAQLGSVPPPGGGSPPATTFVGDANSFATPQWSLAYEVGVVKALENGFAVHAGAQGEFYYPFPLPGYGLSAGISRYFQLGEGLSIAPAVGVRGATDFGIRTIGGSGSFAGAEVAVTIAVHPESRLAVGLVPFASAQYVWTAAGDTPALYAGAVMAVHLDLGLDKVEAVGGFGRVFMPVVESWNSPILGARVGR
jgi:hypothetical protein